jgi:phosphatidylglycerophosphate synthase
MMRVNGSIVFRDGHWIKADSEGSSDVARFSEIRFYYANLVDYLRVLLCFCAYFTIRMEQPILTASLILASTLLDWVDGPVARAYNQCTVFGSGVDWLADIQAQLVTVVWWASLNPNVLPWLLLAMTIEIANSLFDFATTAKERYPILGTMTGFHVILKWCLSNGSYTKLGTFLWLAWPVFSLCNCVDLSWPTRAPLSATLLQVTEYALFVPAVLYLWCELAYLSVMVGSWTEAPRRRAARSQAARYDDGPAGVELLGVLPEAQQELLARAAAATIRKMRAEWQSSIECKKIFWINLWQRSGDGRKLEIDCALELDAWVKSLTASVYGSDIVLDGYGLIINPVGSPMQDWHVDYTLDYSSIFIPLTRLTLNNSMQYVVLPPSLSVDLKDKAFADLDNVDVDLLAEHSDYVSIRQLIAKPFSIIKMDFQTIHRGIANTGNDDRNVFWISVKKSGELLPAEPLVHFKRQPTRT